MLEDSGSPRRDTSEAYFLGQSFYLKSQAAGA